MKDQRKWARGVVRGLLKARDRAMQDQRSSPHYWNGDDWGSISGFRDAEAWVEEQLIKYLLRRLEKRS